MPSYRTEKTYNNYSWIDICNPSEEEMLNLSMEYDLDYLLIQDSLERGHLPKFEKRAHYSFFILRAYTALRHQNVSTILELSNKVSFFISQNRLITIRRREFSFFQKDTEKHANAYEHLLDLLNGVVETYREPAKWQSEDIDKVEKTIFLRNADRISLEDLYFQKAEIRLSKKLLLLTQQVITKLELPSEHSSELEDIKDTLVQLMLEYDEALDDSNNLMHTYLSISAQKNNDVMKLLTVFSAFFLPLTFIVGLYGMNFRYMPELNYKYGYAATVIMMLIISILIFLWFKRKRFL